MRSPSLRGIRKAVIPILNVAYHSGLYRAVGSVYAGRGVIFSMHRFAAPGQCVLHPGHVLGTDVLDETLGTVRRLGWDIVTIDEVYDRLAGEMPTKGSGILRSRRFACFTSDDGFADNLTLALPVFRKHKAPLCVYIATGQVERTIFYWAGANEELILKSDRIELPAICGCGARTLRAETFEEKVLAYQTLDELCHRLGDTFFPILHEMYKRQGVDAQRNLDRLALSLDQAKTLASDPLVTIACHCVSHQRLSLLSEKDAYFEIEQGRRTLERWFNMEVRHLAYPFGRSDACGPREFGLAKGAGFKTAVTTRPGNIFPGHHDRLHCLPRRSIPLNLFNLRNALFGVETILRNERKFQTT